MATQYINYGLGGSGSGGVTSLNTLVGALTLSPGTGISITPSGGDTLTIASTSAGDLTLTAFGSSPNADGASLTGQALTLQPADATHPGGVSTTTQSFAGNKTFLNNLLANVIDAKALTDTMSIGGTNASIINIGNSGATVNIQGTTLYENVTQLQVTDPLITLNKGGGAGSAANSGFEIEENSLITGYVETSGDRNSWLLKAPNTAGIATITPGSSGITINQSSHDPVTLTAVGSSPNANGASLSSQALTLQPADNTNPGVITASTQTIGGDKTFSGQTILGDPGTESTGININGATFQSTLKVSDIDGTNFAQTILHRHSTVLEPLIVGARSNSNTSSHGNIAADQTVFSIYGTGWETDNYKIFGSLNITASTLGSLSSTSSPGKITINTTPNSATSPTAHLTLDSDKSSTFAGTVSATGVNISGLTASYAVVTDSSKNLASLQYTNANTASTLVQRDSSGNFIAGTITATLNGNATTATTATNATNTTITNDTTTNATVYHTWVTANTGDLPQKVSSTKLSFNPSTGALSTSSLSLTTALPVSSGGTGQSSNLTQYGVAYGSSTTAMATTSAGTTGQWLKATTSAAPSFAAFTPPTIQTFTAGASTYTTPAGVLYIKVKIVGSGGGGGGCGTGGSPGSGTAGSASTWKDSTGTTTYLSAGGGNGGTVGNGAGGGNGNAGGTNTTAAGPIILVNMAGAQGGWGTNTLATTGQPGGNGANSVFGGAGSGGGSGQAGGNAATNSGSGGGGGGGGNALAGGGGGAAGGYLEAIFTSPAATYKYSVANASAGGAAGTGGTAGGQSGAGLIIVEEYYQ